MRARAVAAFGVILCFSLSVASAQDADADGVADARDLCPTTPAGASIDPAGCANECDAQIVGDDAFARTLLTQIGVNVAGAFGTIGGAPTGAGYFPRPAASGTDRRLGYVANPDGNDWSSGDYQGDFFLPGSPEEGWGLTWVDGGGASADLGNNTDGLVPGDVVGSVIAADCVPSGLGAGGRGGARIVWRGAWAQTSAPNHRLEVEQEAVILHEGLFILLNVALTNAGSERLAVYYMRNVDPDNNVTLGCTHSTVNTIVQQRPPIGADDRALVSAEQTTARGPDCESFLALAARDPVPAVVTYGGFSNRSARDVFDGAAPFVTAVGSTVDMDQAISLAVRYDIAAGDTVRFSYLYVLSIDGVDDGLQSVSEDTDSDGVPDADDVDDDNDGIPDALEVPSFSTDPGGDADGDGVPNWRDVDHAPGGCVDVAQPRGVCDAPPVGIDQDGDGLPDHLDLDADGDGLTDAREAGGTDDDGDGRPDGCDAVDANGGCVDAGGASLLLGALADTDGTEGPDVFDLDSDGDGIADAIEAYDADGDGALGGGEETATGDDHDGDGIDDAYDPDCNATLCAEAGAPVTGPLDAARDADGDGIGDWLETCGDAYATAGEVCDEGGGGATCTAACLRAVDQPCMVSSECASGLCVESDMTCAACGTSSTPPCPDAGIAMPDAGLPQVDAGQPPQDGGAMDGGVSPSRAVGSGLSCAVGRGPTGAPVASLAVLAAVVLLRRRRRGRARAVARRGGSPP